MNTTTSVQDFIKQLEVIRDELNDSAETPSGFPGAAKEKLLNWANRVNNLAIDATLDFGGGPHEEPAPTTTLTTASVDMAAATEPPGLPQPSAAQLRLQRLSAKAYQEVGARKVPQTERWELARLKQAVDSQLFMFLCDAVGGYPDQFLKYDESRGTVDPDPNVDNLKIIVDLTKLMAIPTSGWNYVAYYYRSEPGVRARLARKALAAASDDINALGGPGMAADSVVEAFYRAKAECEAATEQLLAYVPGHALVKV